MPSETSADISPVCAGHDYAPDNSLPAVINRREWIRKVEGGEIKPYFVKVSDNRWRLAPVEEILETNCEEVVWGDTFDEAKEKILALYPTSHRDLSRELTSYYRDDCSYEVSEEALHDATSLDQVMSLVKEYGSISISHSFMGGFRQLVNKRSGDPYGECGLKVDSPLSRRYHQLRLITEQEKERDARTERERQERMALQASIMRFERKAYNEGDLCAPLRALNRDICSSLALYDPQLKESLGGSLCLLDTLAALFNKCNGKNAHRRLKPFCEYLELWHTALYRAEIAVWLAKGEKMLVKRSGSDATKLQIERCRKLTTWLDKEAKLFTKKAGKKELLVKSDFAAAKIVTLSPLPAG